MSKSTIIQGIQFLSIELKKLGFCENINQLDEAIKSIQTAKPNQPWSYISFLCANSQIDFNSSTL